MFQYIKEYKDGLNNPGGIIIDNSGNIYISDTLNHRVIKLDSNFQYISQFGVTGVAKSDLTGLNQPKNLSIDNGGNIYVADSGNSRLVKLNSNMGYVWRFGPSFEAGMMRTMKNVSGVAVDNNGYMYITDTNNHRIVRITPYGSGRIYGSGLGLNLPEGISIDNDGNIYVADSGNNRIIKLDNTMANILSQYDIGLNNPGGISIDNNGDIYISDTGNHRIVKLNSNMEYITQFGVTGIIKADNTGLNTPQEIFIENNGDMYISDSGNNRVVKLNISSNIIFDILQYKNTPPLLDITMFEQVDTFELLINGESKLLLTNININSYICNLDKIWNELNVDTKYDILIKTNKGNSNLVQIYKPLPEILLYNNIYPNKDILIDYTINPSYDNSNNPLEYTYKISLDSEILFTHNELTNQQITSSIVIPYNKLVKQKYSFITDRNLVITKSNSNGETISYNIPIRIDPKRLFSKYFNGLSNYISINNWVKPLSELTIQIIKKSLTDTEFVVSTDNSLISLTNTILKIGGISTFIGNIYEVRIWEKGFEQPYTYDQLNGDEDKLYALYRLNEYNSNNVYDSCGELHGKFIGNLINQEVVPEGVSYLTLPVIDSENEIVKQHQDHSYEYKIESPRSCFFNSIKNHNTLVDTDHVELSIPNNIIDINKISMRKQLSEIYDANSKVGDILLQPEFGWQRIDDSNINIKYDNGWVTESSPIYTNNICHFTPYNLSKCKFKFKGNRIRLIQHIYNNRTKQGKISIDGNIYNYSGYISISSTSTPLGVERVLTFECLDLEYGEHYVEIYGEDLVYTGTSSTSIYIGVDAIDINENGYLIPIT